MVLSKNDPVSGLRVFRSAKQAGLQIERGVFTRGRSPYRYLDALKDWPAAVERFTAVVPRDYKRVMELIRTAEAAGRDVDEAVMGGPGA